MAPLRPAAIVAVALLAVGLAPQLAMAQFPGIPDGNTPPPSLPLFLFGAQCTDLTCDPKCAIALPIGGAPYATKEFCAWDTTIPGTSFPTTAEGCNLYCASVLPSPLGPTPFYIFRDASYFTLPKTCKKKGYCKCFTQCQSTGLCDYTRDDRSEETETPSRRRLLSAELEVAAEGAPIERRKLQVNASAFQGISSFGGLLALLKILFGFFVPVVEVGKVCPGNIGGDPHFVGFHGTRFDFNGELDKNYCIVSDRGLHVNALLAGYSAPETSKGIRSWMRELGFMWTDEQGKTHKLHLKARRGEVDRSAATFLESATLDGKALAVRETAGSMASAGGLELSFQGTRKSKGVPHDRFEMVLNGGATSILLELTTDTEAPRMAGDSVVHFNIYFKKFEPTVGVHGVLGQTYRDTPAQYYKAVKYSTLAKLLRQPVVADGASGLGFLDGTVKDYEASDILKADCKVAAF